MTNLLSGTIGNVLLGPLNGPLNPAKGLIQQSAGVTGPKPPTPPTAITPPPPDSGIATQSANVQQQDDLLRQRQGRAANVLTSTQGVATGTTPVGTKVLLGS